MKLNWHQIDIWCPWGLVVEGFSVSVVQRMAVGQKPSTLKEYDSKWRCLICCSEEWNINPCSATIHQIADFLNYLHVEKKLSAGSIEGYKTAISNTQKSTCGLEMGKDFHPCSLIAIFQGAPSEKKQPAKCSQRIHLNPYLNVNWNILHSRQIFYWLWRLGKDAQRFML